MKKNHYKDSTNLHKLININRYQQQWLKLMKLIKVGNCFGVSSKRQLTFGAEDGEFCGGRNV